MAIPATACRIGTPASIIAKRAAAHRGHRRGAVRLEDVGHDADRVREVLFARHHRRERTLGKRAVADLTPSRAAHAADFADREGREVVVQHEILPGLALEALDLLRVVGRAQGAGDERLRLTAREHRRTMGARQHAGLDPDRTDFVELAAVETDAVGQHLFPEHFLFQLLEDRPWRRPSFPLRSPAAPRSGS